MRARSTLDWTQSKIFLVLTYDAAEKRPGRSEWLTHQSPDRQIVISTHD